MTLSASSPQTITVGYATAGDSAISSTDFTAQSGTVTFSPTETTKTVTISITSDTLDEADERYFVNLSNATNATIGDSQGVGTITDDDVLHHLHQQRAGV